MSAVLLNENLERNSELSLPESFKNVNSHNLYIYIKSYLASLRANTAHSKTRSEVRGGGKKPWVQKGKGGARAGSIRSPIFVGGGKAFGPRNTRNYLKKINKKQISLALKYALNEQARSGSLLIVDKIDIGSTKTKDANAFFKKLNVKDALIVKEILDDNSYLSFRNLNKVCLIERSELNAYLISTYHCVVLEKFVWENLTKEL